jgi:Uma2 family endonuclease
MSTTTKKPWTAEELGRLPEGWRYEIDEGELVIMAPAGFEHNVIATEVAYRLGTFVRNEKLGKILTNELGVYLHHDPDTLRGLDVAFYSNERLARIKDRQGFPDVPPDLAVEVHLPDERDMHRKVQQYLAAGVRSVWVIDPRQRTLTQHRPGSEPVVTVEKDATVREPVLPGFECRLHELFGEE